MTAIAAFTFWHTPTPQTVTAAAIVGLLIVGLFLLLAHHTACEIRIDRATRRDRQLIAARKAAHQERKWARIAADDQAIADARAERDKARRLAVQMLGQVDQLQAELADVRSALLAATNVVHRQNRAQLGHLARVIEADQTLQLPVVSVGSTRQLPALPYRVLQGAS